MALSKSSSGPSPVILLLIVGMGMVVGYVYYSQALADASYDVPVASTLNDPVFLHFKDLRFDFALFSGPAFTSLRALGDVPINPGITGKEDLFGPF